MRRLTFSAPLPSEFAGAVVALGNFDGFHRGHQAVVGRAVARARADGRPAIVATFDPHPVRHFRPDRPPFRLTTLDQRERLFAAAGADAMLVFGFDDALALVEAEGFVSDILADRVGAAAVVTGQDFTFGRGKRGDVRLMGALCEQAGIATEAVGPVADAGGVISSSRIRDALVAGEPEAAAALLTRPFAIAGPVIHGDKRGRTIGYPTANMLIGDYLRPAYGIYAVRARVDGGDWMDGVANLGIRPTFDPPVELLETHLFDVAPDLYGQELEVALVAFLRSEARFDGLDALVEQMDKDSAEARRRLAALPPLP